MDDLLKHFNQAHVSHCKTQSASQPTNTPKKACDCGYDPHASMIPDFSNIFFSDTLGFKTKESKCSVKLALRNHLTFPSFEMMTGLDQPSRLYYKLKDSCFSPSRHWATLIEITHDLSFMRPRYSGLNHYGDELTVHFYHDNFEIPTTFTWDQLKPGKFNL